MFPPSANASDLNSPLCDSERLEVGETTGKTDRNATLKRSTRYARSVADGFVPWTMFRKVVQVQNTDTKNQNFPDEKFFFAGCLQNQGKA
jgi:hypothetical protein